MFFFMIMFLVSHIESLILIQKDLETICRDLEQEKSINETINYLRDRVAAGKFSKHFFDQSQDKVEKVIRIIRNDLGNTTISPETRANDMSGCANADKGVAISYTFTPEIKLSLPIMVSGAIGEASSYGSSHAPGVHPDPDTKIIVKDSGILEDLLKWMQNSFPVPCKWLKFPLFINANKPGEIRDLFINLALQRQIHGLEYLRKERMSQLRDIVC